MLLILPFWIIFKLLKWMGPVISSILFLLLVACGAMAAIIWGPDAMSRQDRTSSVHVGEYVAVLGLVVLLCFALIYVIIQWSRGAGIVPRFSARTYLIVLSTLALTDASAGYIVAASQPPVAYYKKLDRQAHKRKLASERAILVQNLGRRIDGIPCTATVDGAPYTAQSNLSLFVAGKPVGIPHLAGGKQLPDTFYCSYWLETWSPEDRSVIGYPNVDLSDGTIWTQAPWNFHATLGQFFDFWGKSLSRRQLGRTVLKSNERMVSYVNGRAYTGDPRKIPLYDRENIVLEVGPPFVQPRPIDDFCSINGCRVNGVLH